MAVRKQNMAPMWKKLMELVDLDEPTSFLDPVYLGCTQRECKLNETIIEEYTKMFESRISAGAEKLPGWEQPHARGLTTWKDILENTLSDTASWQTRVWSSYTKFQVLAWMIINSNRKNLNQLENYPQVCSHIVLKCLYLARNGRPYILWSVHKLARAVTKWTHACYKRLARLISYIHNTNEFRQCCHVGNRARHCRLGLFQDSDFAGDLEDSNSTSGGVL